MYEKHRDPEVHSGMVFVAMFFVSIGLFLTSLLCAFYLFG